MCFRVALHSSLRTALVLFIVIALLPAPCVSMLVSALAQGQSQGHSRRNGPPPRPDKPEGAFPNVEDIKGESLIEREPPAPIYSTIRSQRNSGKPWDGRRVGDSEPPRGEAQSGGHGQMLRAHARRRPAAPLLMYEDQFIQNFFTIGFARSATYDETLYWNYQFRAAYNQSAESLKFAAVELGRTIFESATYAVRNRDAHWYVYDLYKTYLMRDPDSTGWANWEATVGTNGREYVRRGFEESTEFANLLANIVLSGPPSATATSLISARVDPRNQPGNGMLARDAAWSVPLLSLPGRNGLDLGLALSYSSMVWTRSGPYIYFDEDNGFPSPGFRLGFPTVQRKVFDAQTGKKSYLLITGSGKRVELRQSGTSNIYEAGDSSYLQITDNGSSLLLRDTSGTQMELSDRNGEYRCTSVKDRNGNYLTINYDTLGHITNVIDTLGRVINFNYDTNANLISITQAWNGQPAHQWVSFGWSTRTMQSSFTGLTALVGSVNGAVLPVITQVALNDTSYFTFDYTNSLQVSLVKQYFGGVERNATSFTYETPGSDVPRLLSTSVSAQNWTGINGVPAQVTTQYSVAGDGACVLTAPDGTIYKEYYGTGWQRGLTTLSEIWSGGVRQKWTTTAWTQDNTSVGYEVNPRVTETNIYDAGSNRRRSVIDYGPYAAYGLPYVVHEYAADGATLIRDTFTDYNLSQAYLDRRLIGLVSAVHITNAAQYQTKITYDYDDPARLQGVPAAATQHDVNYNLSFTARGNVTAVTRWDVNDINNAAKKLTTYTNYYNTGTPISTTDPAGHQNSITYADSFSDSVNRNTFAYPTTMTDADGFSSLVQYNFDFGATTRTQSPAPSGQSQGAIQTMTYNNLGQLERITTTNNGAYKRFWYGADYTASFATVNNVADEAYSAQIVDGLGRVIITMGNHPGSTGGYSFVNTIYNQMGRAWKVSNPTEVNGSWVPSGDDAAGMYYTQQTYDWKGRPLVTTNPDGTTKEASYAGCGCAGGEVATLTDEGTIDAGVAKRRQQKIYSDVLGRALKTEILNWQGGSVYSTTVNSYNARDQITQVRQYAGAEGSGTYQDTTLTYDGYGRLKTKHVPEQSAGANTVWDYNSDDTVKKITDGRGAVANYGYNNRHLLTGVTYTPPSGSQIPVPGAITYEYDAASNRTLMTDGTGSITYGYDSLSRMSSESRIFIGFSGTYNLTYSYNLANTLTGLSIPFRSQQIGYNYDNAGRLSSVTGSGFTATFVVWPNTYRENVTSFASNIKYRAWGGRKSMTYGNTTSEQTTYNSRLQPSTYTLNNMNYTNINVCCPNPTYSTMTWTYDYYNDGRIKTAWDSSNNWFDRAYKYDHAGRLKEATTYRRARGLSPYPTNQYPDPYFQTITYDAFNHMSRTGLLYTGGPSDVGTWINNRRTNPGWQYDADGNTVVDPNFNQTFDAAGKPSHSVALAMIGDGINYYLPRSDITQTYDGSGAPGKRVQISRQPNPSDSEAPPIEDIQTTSYLRSTVLGGAAVVEFNGPTSMDTVNIYAGGQRIAREMWGNIGFEHTNPVTGSRVSSAGYSGYRGTGREERDFFGAEIPNFNPYPSSDTYVDHKFGEQLYIEGGDPFDYSTGREIDGIPVSEAEFQRRVGTGSVNGDIFVAGRYAGSIDLRTHSSFGVPWTLSARLEFWAVDSNSNLNTSLASDRDNPDEVIETATTSTSQRWLGTIIVNVMFSEQNPTQTQLPKPIPETRLNPDKLRSDLQGVLNGRKDCGDFIRGLLFTVAQYTQLPLYREDFLDDPSKILDAVASQEGYFLATGQGASGYAKGGLRARTAKITLDISMGRDGGASMGRGFLLLHEDAHEAGAVGYSDRELAIAAHQTAWAQGYRNIPSPPTTNDPLVNSQYLSNMIFQACHPRQGRDFK